MVLSVKGRNNLVMAAVLAAFVGLYAFGTMQKRQRQYSFADETVIGNGKPVLLEFGSDYCRPCREMKPVLEQLDKQFSGIFTVAYVDIWKKEALAEQYQISVIPTQIFFDAEGKELFRHEGFYPAERILAKWKELGIEAGTKH